MRGEVRSRTRVRAGAVALVAVAPLTLGLLDAPAVAAVAKPGGLDHKSGTTGIVLSWKPVRGATEYHVQVATSASFASPVLDVETVNTHATPTTTVPFGKIWWRVSATKGGGWSKWSTESFHRAQRSGPVLAAADEDAHYRQATRPPVLKWNPVSGAQGYTVEIDTVDDTSAGTADWVDSKTYTTETTSLVPTETQEPDEYVWRVRADFGSGISSLPSESRDYWIEPLPAVQMDKTDSSMEDVVLEWDPVPGAADYEIRVSTDDDFNVITDRRYVSGTRYSPPTTYDNATYWWQVRARDVFGQTEEWTAPATQTGEFQRTWPDKPQLVYPASGATPTGDLYFQWTPVQHAAWYLLDFGTDPGFATSTRFNTCKTQQTTYTPGWSRQYLRDQCMPGKAGTYYWRVRAIDSNDSPIKSVNGRFSEVRSFSWTPPTTPTSTSTPSPVTGQRVALEGDGRGACTARLSAVCENVLATPMLDWEPAPGAAFYIVYLAHDRNFTNMVTGFGDVGDPDTMFHTTNTRFVPPTMALPDTQAGEAYFWFVRPCTSTYDCGLTPEEASNAFQKKSPAVELTSPAPGATIADQATFSWQDYLDTNTSVPLAQPFELEDGKASVQEQPTQTARSYRIQVSPSESFAATSSIKVYEAVVDQATYTAYSNAYPEGQLWWRVQAIDGSGNGLTWSKPRSFTKASPSPTVVGPTDGEKVNGVQPFRWQPLPYAKYYDLEAYRNADTAASSGNLALKVTNVRQAAYTAPKPLQALGQDFVWRIRRTDYDGHAGAWSSWHRFRVAASPSRLLSPDTKVSSTRGLFKWKASAQAAYYRWELRNSSYLEQYVETTSTSYAPTRALSTGRHTWRVISYDSERHVLRTTKWRAVKVR